MAKLPELPPDVVGVWEADRDGGRHLGRGHRMLPTTRRYPYYLTMRLFLLVACPLLACGTTGLSAKGREVALLDADPGPQCTAIGTVAGSADPLFGGLRAAGDLVESARNDARNEAGKKGATHLRLAGTPERWVSGTFGGGKGVTVSGVAYRCERAGGDSTAWPSPAGCSKDMDCKGVRICEAGQCVYPAGSPLPEVAPR